MINNNYKATSAMFPVIMLSMALALRQMSMTIVMPFISTYCKDLIGYTPLLAGLAIGILGLTQAFFQIPFGILSDRYGNKKMMLIGLAMVVAGLVLAYFSNNMGLLILARALQGSGAVIGVGYSWGISLVQENERTKAMSILGAFISAAAALAFAIGPLLRGIMSVRWMFMVCAILIFLNLLFILFILKDSKHFDQTPVPPLDETIRALVKNRSFVKMNLAAFVNNFMMVSVFYAVPLYLGKVTGEQGMWKVFVPAIIVAVLCMKFAVSWSDKRFNHPILLASFLVSSISILFYFNSSSFIFLLTGTTLFLCGYITLSTLIAANVNNMVEDSRRGTANGIFNSFQYVGNFIGALVTGAIWGISESWSLLLISGIGLIGMVLMIPQSKPQITGEQA